MALQFGLDQPTADEDETQRQDLAKPGDAVCLRPSRTACPEWNQYPPAPPPWDPAVAFFGEVSRGVRRKHGWLPVIRVPRLDNPGNVQGRLGECALGAAGSSAQTGFALPAPQTVQRAWAGSEVRPPSPCGIPPGVSSAGRVTVTGAT